MTSIRLFNFIKNIPMDILLFLYLRFYQIYIFFPFYSSHRVLRKESSIKVNINFKNQYGPFRYRSNKKRKINRQKIVMRPICQPVLYWNRMDIEWINHNIRSMWLKSYIQMKFYFIHVPNYATVIKLIAKINGM